MPDFELEIALWQKGYNLICGVDEAGRGPLAGPVCAAAVILPEGCQIEGLDDSKKLTEKKREALFDEITGAAICYSIAFAQAEEIEKYNILEATMLAMKRAVEGLKIKPDYVLVDGSQTIKNLDLPCGAVIKGDSISCSIAAASILAKVSRDRLMMKLDKEYPEYNFKQHKGYGTKEHIELIKKYGPSKIHRKSFLTKIIAG
ncbi:MAG TPA: ribonuclease HII [Clostridiales bacterium]|nr:ribonuclease HII [Clostridiales bacterium]